MAQYQYWFVLFKSNFRALYTASFLEVARTFNACCHFPDIWDAINLLGLLHVTFEVVTQRWKDRQSESVSNIHKIHRNIPVPVF